MDFEAVQTQINDLPATFKRLGNPFQQWIDALTAELARNTNASDAVLQQIDLFVNAQFGWLDIWGLLFDIPRLNNEADGPYRARIQYNVLAGAGPPVAIAKWIKAVWRVDVTVVENLPNLGYTIEFPATVSDTFAITILASLVRIRPAGVPITGTSRAGVGLYLNTVNFLDAPNVTGAYLSASGIDQGAPAIGPATNNAQPAMPETFLVDPTINPSLGV